LKNETYEGGEHTPEGKNYSLNSPKGGREALAQAVGLEKKSIGKLVLGHREGGYNSGGGGKQNKTPGGGGVGRPNAFTKYPRKLGCSGAAGGPAYPAISFQVNGGAVFLLCRSKGLNRHRGIKKKR